MAYSNKNVSNMPSAPASDDSWKAQGFVNFSLELPNGKTKKLAAAKLYESDLFDAKLIARLQEEGGVEAFKGKLVVTFNLAMPVGLELGF
jgi:hypothetical protein